MRPPQAAFRNLGRLAVGPLYEQVQALAPVLGAASSGLERRGKTLADQVVNDGRFHALLSGLASSAPTSETSRNADLLKWWCPNPPITTLID